MISKLVNQSYLRLLSKPMKLTGLQNASFSFARERTRYFVVEYKYIEDMYYKRIQYRDQHDKWVETIESRGNQIIGGSGFPLDGAIMIFNCDEQQIVENFINQDPYKKNGLISSFTITEVERKTREELQEVSKTFAYR